jgi:hypothetical protein
MTVSAAAAKIATITVMPPPATVKNKVKPQFQSEAAAVLKRLQRALADVIAQIPHPRGPIDKAADLERTLKIRKTLAWQVFRMANSPNPLVEGAKLPGQFAMERFFNAAAKAGVSEKKITEVSTAFSEFGRLIKTHAGDRSTFESLVSGLTPHGGLDQVELTQRRAAFKANSHIWGVQARTQLCCGIIAPSRDDPMRGDGLALRGYVDLKRLRPDARVIIARSQASDNDGKVRHAFTREPLDPRGMTEHGITLLTDFSSKPPPRFASIPGAGGEVTLEIEGETVGNRSKVTCLTGDVVRGALARFRDQHNLCEIIRAIVRAPCEVLIHDVVVHEAMYGGMIRPSVQVFSNVGGEPTALPREVDRLPQREEVVYMGRGAEAFATPDVPHYVEMAAFAFKKVGWNPIDFHVWRCRVEYPVLPSSVVVQFDLPSPPEKA